jgi:Domain of unknown function (DUF4276)
MRVEILVEEKSMKIFLERLIPRINAAFVIGNNVFIHSFQGYTDLTNNVKRKVSAYNSYAETIFLIVMHDQDEKDCRKLKSELVNLCQHLQKPSCYAVRIPCRELENWYLGDKQHLDKLINLAEGVEKLRKLPKKSIDSVQGFKLIAASTSGPVSKVKLAEIMGKTILIQGNLSNSFSVFVKTIQHIKPTV